MAQENLSFENDGTALKVLVENFEECAGVFRKKNINYKPTAKEEAAIDFLFYEWDYAYDHDKVWPADWSRRNGVVFKPVKTK